MVSPGDNHVLLHSVKALLKRYWGAVIERVAKELSGYNKKAARGRNYRMAHHHLEIMYEALMTEMIKEYSRAHPATKRQAANTENLIPQWIKATTDEHQTFMFLAQFRLKDYPVYLAFRTALCTEGFKLRWGALQRLAPVFFGHDKDLYQCFVSVHLEFMARMTDDDHKAMSPLIANSLGTDVFARIGLDEKQEIANKLYKGTVMSITTSYVRKMGAIVSAREVNLSEVQREFFVTGKCLDRVVELLRKKLKVVLTTRPALKGGKEFRVNGKSNLMALDRRQAATGD